LILGLHAAVFGGLIATLSHTQGLATVQIRVLNPAPLDINKSELSPRK
jgi:hypothetical protein